MRADHWMPLYVGDYLADTAHLSTEAHGAYLLLLMHQWRTGSIPHNHADQARIVRLSGKAWRALSPAVLAFFEDTPEGLKQPRVERIRAQQNQKIQQRRAAGKASAAAREAQRELNERSTTVDAPLARNRREPEPEPEEEEKDTPSPPSGARSPRGYRLPSDWQPNHDDTAFAAKLGLDPPAVAAQFRDHWHAKPGKDGRKLDWPATWRNWCRRNAEQRRPQRREPESRLGWLLRDMQRDLDNAPEPAPIAYLPRPAR
jgi:uncharacterized protein YdaU (DUF1376 family)